MSAVDEWYPWLKVVHILAAIAWMAGLFYLPRLMVYHAAASVGSDVSEQFKVMERRLLKAIMRPALVATWAFGVWMAGLAGWLSDGSWWLWLKSVLVLGLTGIHGALEWHCREFAADSRGRSHVYFRVLNEIPTLLLIGIVILVVIKPF